MNKLELINTFKNEARVTKAEAAAVVNLFFDEMSKALAEDDRVEIRGLCSFYVKQYKSYTGRNPKTGMKVSVTPKKLPFFKIGTTLKGHEFHYTYPVSVNKAKFAAEVKRGFGFNVKRDCLIYKNVFASYTHLHALGVKNWAISLLRKR